MKKILQIIVLSFVAILPYTFVNPLAESKCDKLIIEEFDLKEFLSELLIKNIKENSNEWSNR